MQNRLSRKIVAIVASLVIAGCSGRTDRPELGEVSGKVTLDGQPAAGVLVLFHPEKGRGSSGVTDKEGNYKLNYLHDTPGAKIGVHKVAIATPQEDESDPEARKIPERIPKQYNASTTLTADVKAGANEINFPLTSK